MRFTGEHTEKVTLKKKSVTIDTEYNEETVDWDSNDETIYAEFYERQGKEGGREGQVVVLQDVRCKLRYKSELDPDQGGNPEENYRIKRGSTTYDITSVVKEGRRTELRLMLQRRDNQ